MLPEKCQIHEWKLGRLCAAICTSTYVRTWEIVGKREEDEIAGNSAWSSSGSTITV